MTQFLNGTQTTETLVNVSDIVARVGRNEMILVDVRGTQEVDVTGIAKGAIHIPLLNIPAMTDPNSPECLKVFKSGAPVALYCATGVRSRKAAEQLLAFGHSVAVNIGGLKDWAEAGGAVVSAN